MPSRLLGALAITVPLIGAATTHAASDSAGVLVATGTVTAGSHVRPGAVVRLYAWPSDHVLQGLKAGQAVPRTLLATTRADSAGAYQVRVSPAALSTAAVSGGYANLEIDSGNATWFFTYRTAKANPGDSPAGSDGTAVNVTLTSSRRVPSVPDAVTCAWIFREDIGTAWAIVGQGYVTVSHISQAFVYSGGQHSSLGVGTSASDKAGSFHGDGTVSEDASQTQGFPGRGQGYFHYRSPFLVGKWAYICSGDPTPQGWMVHSDGFVLGDNIPQVRSAPAYGHCQPELKGSYAKTGSEHAVNWSGGFSITQVGFGASAQTGYDSSAQLVYHYGRNGHVCGSNGGYPGRAPQMVATG